MAGQLADATSPYLVQHADNPIDWRVWSPEAFAEASRRDVPVMVSIGYATCHWCHVMARESFSDPELGALANDSVVAIKVDREELPAVDGFFMDALLAMRGQGGWPLTVFTTPDARPFFAGTYFPPQPRDGIPSLAQVITTIARTWADDRQRAEGIASQLARSLVRLPDLSRGRQAGTTAPRIEEDTLAEAARTLLAAEDSATGGFGTLPKFPAPLSAIQLLHRHTRLHAGEGSAAPSAELAAVRRQFAGIASGGIRDQVDGGISRYSVDAQWHIPHFEKMLFDNAQHLRAAVDWYRVERQCDAGSRWTQLALRELRDTADFLLRRMELPGGGFASGLDADSLDAAGERSEGAHYLEKEGTVPSPFLAVGPVEAAHPERQWAVAFPAVAEWAVGEHGDSTPPWLRSEAGAAVDELVRRRAERPLPLRDDKRVTEWNALTIIALAEAGRALHSGEGSESASTARSSEGSGESVAPFSPADLAGVAAECSAAARRAFDAILTANRPGGSPSHSATRNADTSAHTYPTLRSSTDGRPGPGAGTLADVAQLALAAHAVGELDTARSLLDEALAFVLFPGGEEAADGVGASAAGWDGATLLDAHSDGIVPVRGSDPLDDTTPSGRAALVEALRVLGDSDAHAELRRILLASVEPALVEASRSLGWVLAEAELAAERS